jgi:phage shock protein B
MLVSLFMTYLAIPLVANIGPFSIPLVVILGIFAIKALKLTCRGHPIQGGLTDEDRARLNRITEALEKMENRVSALETLLKDEQVRTDTTHEKVS